MARSSTSWTITCGINDMVTQFQGWDFAVNRANAASPYCGRSYIMAALEAYHQNDSPMLVCADVGHEIAGVLALVERPLVRMGQTIHEVGFPFNPNTILNHPLIDVTNTEHAIEVAKALIQGAFSSGADTVLLDHMPIDAGTTEVFLAAAQALGMPCDVPTATRALYYSALNVDWPDYLATRSRNHRWQIKKSMRKAAEDPTITVRRCRGRDSLLAHLEDWFSVESRSWQGSDTKTAMSDADRRFHRLLIENLPEHMLGDLWLVYSAGQPVAALRMLADKGQVSVHTMHFDADFKAQAPGAVAFHEMMKAACDAGLNEVDMHGTTSFFSRYATGQRPHHSLRIYRKGLRGAILQKMRAALQTVQSLKTGQAP